jgi:hypothetical protein
VEPTEENMRIPYMIHDINLSQAIWPISIFENLSKRNAISLTSIQHQLEKNELEVDCGNFVRLVAYVTKRMEDKSFVTKFQWNSMNQIMNLHTPGLRIKCITSMFLITHFHYTGALQWIVYHPESGLWHGMSDQYGVLSFSLDVWTSIAKREFFREVESNPEKYEGLGKTLSAEKYRILSEWIPQWKPIIEKTWFAYSLNDIILFRKGINTCFVCKEKKTLECPLCHCAFYCSEEHRQHHFDHGHAEDCIEP